MDRYDVLIVGLGPTGTTLAALLAQRGLKVAAFDKLPSLYPLPRAIGLDHEAMRILQQLGLAKTIEPHIAPYRPSEYRGVDGKPILRLDAAPPPHPLGWFPNYVFNQPALEQALRSHVTSNTNALIQVESEVVDFGQDENAAWVSVSHKNSEPVRFEGTYLVACDGGASPIRKQLGIRFEDLGFDEAWLVIDSIVPPEKAATLPQTQVQYCNPERPATFVVGPGNHRRWEIMLQPGDSTATPFPEDEIWNLLAPWVKPGEITLWRSAAYRFHGLIATQWRAGRILLAGDAAHMTPPFMAQGMMQGLRDALNLSWKLSCVLADKAHDSLLDSYEQERRPHALATTRAAIQLGRLICERDPQQAAKRDITLRARHKGEIATTIRQSMIPGLSAGLLDTASPGHGRIFPQPCLAAPEKNALLDDLTGPTFRLFALSLPSVSEQVKLLKALRPLNGALISLAPEHNADACKDAVTEDMFVIEEAGAVIEPWMRALDINYAIVRPDHYVYGTTDNVQETIAMLHTLQTQLSQFNANP